MLMHIWFSHHAAVSVQSSALWRSLRYILFSKYITDGGNYLVKSAAVWDRLDKSYQCCDTHWLLHWRSTDNSVVRRCCDAMVRISYTTHILWKHVATICRIRTELSDTPAISSTTWLWEQRGLIYGELGTITEYSYLQGTSLILYTVGHKMCHFIFYYLLFLYRFHHPRSALNRNEFVTEQ